LRGQRRYEAPRFEGLPLRDIEWVMFVPEGARYTSFGGSMQRVYDYDSYARQFDIQHYLALNRARRDETIEEAGRLLDQGAKLLKAGQQRQARDVLRTAMNFSQGEADLNEDARVQFRNLQMQQVQVGLFNRRGSLRSAANIVEDSEGQQAPAQLTMAQDAQFTPEYYDQVQQSLSVRDRSALEVVAERMVRQQDAAKITISAIRAAIPEHGVPLRFHRALLINPEESLDVEFSVVQAGIGSHIGQLLPAALLFGLLLLATRKKQKLQ
jgi:hypothetical protein